ncbi:MAG TPA: DEAD/DEAH box helicase, partial [archaeon]|nr:DEAD/DEAH box helicase [archaeon]
MFEGFEPALKRLVRARFSEPTEIQRQVIPHVLAGRNALVISETGSGKTESVLLPIFDLWVRERAKAEAAADAAHVAEHTQDAAAGAGLKPKKGPPAFARALKPISILYLTPLKSLNRDLLSRVEWWAEKLGFEVAVRHGDTSQHERSMQAANPADLLISTPETLQSVLVGKVMRQHLANVRWVVVDEVHELVDSKRGVQLTVGLERLKELIKNAGGAEPQLIGLSATVGSPALVAEWLRGSSAPVTVVNASSAKRIAIRVSSPEATAKDRELAQELHMSPETTARLRMIAEHIREKEAVLVFTNTRESAEALSSRLRVLDRTLPIETHHSSLAKDVRISAEQRFKSQELKALLCTSSLELGIDIGAVDFMVQYMSPRQVLKLLQRLGRAGHSLRKVSEGTIIASDIDDCFESAVIGRLALQRWVEETHCYEEALDVLGQQIIGLALEEYKIPLEKAYGIVRKAYPYRNLSKERFIAVARLLEKLRLLWVNEPGSGFSIVGAETRSATASGLEDMTRPEAASELEEAAPFAEDGELALKRSKRAWEFYYGNLSTIPDSKHYQIFDTYAQKPVGSLDAEFVAMHGTPGTAFIVKGSPWRILEVTQDQVLVEPMGG